MLRDLEGGTLAMCFGYGAFEWCSELGSWGLLVGVWMRGVVFLILGKGVLRKSVRGKGGVVEG